MKVFDGHVFLGRTIYVENSPEGIIEKMDKVGIDVSVVIAPPPGPFFEEGNRLVREAVRRYPKRLIGLYRANPQIKGEEERVRAAFEARDFLGMQLDPTNDGYSVGSTIVEPFIKVAEELKAPVYVHSGDSIFCPPEYVSDLASKFQNVKFVTPTSRRAPRAARDCKNLYLMTRPFPTSAFKRGRGLETYLDRLIFATDSPLGSPEIEMRRVELASLDQETKEKILGDNLQRILDIKDM